MNAFKGNIEIVLLIGLITLIGCAENRSDNCNHVNLEFVEKYADLNLNLKIAFDDFGNINKCAKELKKPILTIYGCYACLGYQKGVWQPLADEEVNSILQNDFLIRYYHIDNKSPLPDSIISETQFKTVGEFFKAKQINNYQIYSQPIYTITDWKENDLTEPFVGYVSRNEMEKFIIFIRKGKIPYVNKIPDN